MNSGQPPVVSFIMPAYNAARFIRESIDSVLSQSFESLELIVVDDGSTDATCSLVPDNDHRVRLLSQKNGGPSKARNTGLLHAVGDYVWHLDADDVIRPGALSEAVTALSSDAGLAGVVGRWSLMDEAGCPTSGSISLWPSGTSARSELFAPMLLRTLFPPSAALFRRAAIQRVNGWDDNLWCAEDRDLWLRILNSDGHFLFSDQEWTQYREHGSNATLNLNRIKLHTELFLQKWFGSDELAGRDYARLGPYVACLAFLYMSRQCRSSSQQQHASLFVENALSQLTGAELDPQAVSAVLWEVAGSANEDKFVRTLWPVAGEEVAEFCWANLSASLRKHEVLLATKRLSEIMWNRPTFLFARIARRLKPSSRG